MGLSGSRTCLGYPVSIFFIVINEFCERFSYYGMKAILTLYFRYFFLWSDNVGTAVYHTFVALCYLTPILGAIIADSWLGKFKTIVSLSIVYTIGQVVTAVSSISELSDTNSDGAPDNLPLHVALSMIGLALIALGTGGIKPCVSAFGGDQFEEGQEKQRNRFFSIFYLAINAGSLLSTIITPMLRVQKCGGQESCYPLAFGVPAALMAVALIVFVLGSRMYRKLQPQGNIMAKVVKCIGFAIKNRFRHRSKEFPKREHWLDWAKEKYDARLISQIKMVTRVLFLYIPLPMFWALFDQQGSRWTLQATTMSGKIGSIEIQPDQMQTANAVLIVIMVPIVDAVVYPLIAKCFNFTPLRKMVVGMFLASMAFVATAFVQMEVDKTLPVFAQPNQYQIKVLNVENHPINVTFSQMSVLVKNNSQTDEYLTFDADKLTSITVSSDLWPPTEIPITNLTKGQRHTLLLGNTSRYKMVKDGLNSKPPDGKNGIRFVNTLAVNVHATVEKEVFANISSYSISEYKFFRSGVKYIKINYTGIPSNCNDNDLKTVNFEYGSAYTYVIKRKSDNCPELQELQDMHPNQVSILLQIPQYFLLTCGEVVFSVTGLEFSYSQAPSNMKSVLQAGWLFTVAVGNIIVLIVAGAGQISEQWAEYILFASLLLVVCVIFAIMARFYTYVNPAEIEAQFDEDEKKKQQEMTEPDAQTGDTTQTPM
ncbi:PREDICTED: solute carrier family 15 member 1 [Condylura cristata]|uniref:solute carrier family 15 member 1 n=1 Tax=Condylura cristata TaxID=143302 RepID=UPI0003343042|nr:PREDICTED: solute carrier family 15 member 1 [Condylura cristata]